MIKATWHGWRLELQGEISHRDLEAIIDAGEHRTPVILCGRPVLIQSVTVYNEADVWLERGAKQIKPERSAKAVIETVLYSESVYSPNVGGVVTPLLPGKGA